MKLAKRIVSLALCAVLALSLVPAASAAASVRVTLPQFRVTLGGQTIDPAKEEYPFLVYKDGIASVSHSAVDVNGNGTKLDNRTNVTTPSFDLPEIKE